MNNTIEYQVISMLSEGYTLSDIVCEIARTCPLDEVYNAGALRFEIDEDGDVVCVGTGFVDCIARPSKHGCLDDVHEKFIDYFKRAVYLDLTGAEYLVIEIRYGDLDQFQAFSKYVWDYLKHRISVKF